LNGAATGFGECPIGCDEPLDHGRDQLGWIGYGLPRQPPKDFGVGRQVAVE